MVEGGFPYPNVQHCSNMSGNIFRLCHKSETNDLESHSEGANIVIQVQPTPALQWYFSHRHNLPVIFIECVRIHWIVQDCETLRNRNWPRIWCNALHAIAMYLRPTIDAALQKVKREDWEVLRGKILGIFSNESIKIVQYSLAPKGALFTQLCSLQWLLLEFIFDRLSYISMLITIFGGIDPQKVLD